MDLNQPLVPAAGGLRLISRTIYRGPHLYSHLPMVRLQLDLGELEDWPSNRLPGFNETLTGLLPGLGEHGCSYHQPGGFLRRLQDGTWLGHIIEHVALELQTLAGHPVTRGKTRSVRGRPGVYNIMFEYRDERVGEAAGFAALRLVESLLPTTLRGLTDEEGYYAPGEIDQPFDMAAQISRLKALVKDVALGPSTRALVEEARRRGIPVQRLDDFSFIQLGQGARQKRFRAGITSQTSHLGVETAGNKALTKSLLAQAGLPTARGATVRTADEAVAAASKLRKPVVTKPLDGNHGRGVSLDLHTPEQVRWGFEQARPHARRVIVEEMLSGRDYRILVVAGEVVAVAERVPAHVVGDGERSVAALIDAVNADPRRGEGHEAALTRIKVDDHVREMLTRAGLTLESIPEAGTCVPLRATANLSTGGMAIDRTDEIHPDNAAIAIQAAAMIGLDVAGMDFLCPDITRSVRGTGGGIVEINASPGLRMHLEPSQGRARDVARPIIRSLFPPGAPSRIPIFAITGTNGKSTVTRMVAHILQQTGLTVGLTSTSGIYVNDHLLVEGDASGPKSARRVLANPTVEAAVLEVARGGILREGLGFDVCDVGAVLNISADHLGLKDINTLGDLAAVKSVVVESVRRRGASVLNADDPLTVRMARHARGRVCWFSLEGGATTHQFVRRHLAAGGQAAILEPAANGGSDLVLYRDGERIRLIGEAEVPATLDGAARFNTANALAAALMCQAEGIPLEAIRKGLATFTSDFAQNPGRLNIYDGLPFRVIMDYAHNPASLTALAEMAQRLKGDGRVIAMVSTPGDRRDQDIRQMGEIAAAAFDEIVFREAPDGRGRPAGELCRLLREGAIDAGAPEANIHCILKEAAAVEHSLRLARPGDLVIITPTSVDATWRQILGFRPSLSAAAPAPAAAEAREIHV